VLGIRGPAKAKVDGQAAIDFKVVLDIGAVVIGVHGSRIGAGGEGAVIDSEQRGSEAIGKALVVPRIVDGEVIGRV